MRFELLLPNKLDYNQLIIVDEFSNKLQYILDYPNPNYLSLDYADAKMMGQALDMSAFSQTNTRYGEIKHCFLTCDYFGHLWPIIPNTY